MLNCVHNSVTGKLKRPSMSSHSSSKNRLKSHGYIMMTQMSWTNSLTHTHVFILSELIKCFVLIIRSTVLFLKIVPTQTLRQAFLNQNRVLCYTNMTAQSLKQASWYWLLTCIAHTFLPNFPSWLKGKESWDMLCQFRGLNRLLDPTLQCL